VLTRMSDSGPFKLRWSGVTYRLSTRWVLPTFLVVAVLFFIYFYPVWTALPISQSSYLDPFPVGKMWLRSWI
ncbi:MAG: hypothetical protein ACREOS_01965, partial [Candidatus Dormibacteraceae bacterium]